MGTSDTNRASKKRLRDIIRAKSVMRAERGDHIVMVNGEPAEWLIDLRMTFMDSEGLSILANLFWEQFEKELPFQVGGLEAGSIPLVAAVITEGLRRGHRVNGFFVRKERKEYGRQQRIEGRLTGDPIVVLDDLMNSGGTLEQVVVALEDVDKSVRDAFVVVDYENPQGHAYLQEHKIHLTHLFTLKDCGIRKSFKFRPVRPAAFQRTGRWVPPELGRFYVVPKSTPALDDKRIYFGTDAGVFWALDLHTLQPIWQFRCQHDGQGKGIFSSPVLHEERVYFGSYDGSVYCLSATTGELIWRFSEADWVGSSPALAVDIGLLFIGLEHAAPAQHGSAVALDLATGEKVWEYPVKELLHGSPAYSKKYRSVAIGTNDASLLLLDAKTGKKKWEFFAGGEIKYRPMFDEKRGSVLAGSHDGKFYVIDITTGKELWSYQTGDVIYSTPLIVGRLCFVSSSDRSVYVFDLDQRKLLQRVRGSGKFWASPRRIGKFIFVGNSDGGIYVLRFDSGRLYAKLQLPERITNAVVYSKKHDKYYALACANQLFTFKHKK